MPDKSSCSVEARCRVAPEKCQQSLQSVQAFCRSAKLYVHSHAQMIAESSEIAVPPTFSTQ